MLLNYNKYIKENNEYKTFDDLEFVVDVNMMRTIEYYNLDKSEQKQARMNFNNGYSISVLCGDMYYSNGIDTYEIMAWDNNNVPIFSKEEQGADDVKGYLTKDEVNDEMIRIQKIKPKERLFTPEDPYGEEEWDVNEGLFSKNRILNKIQKNFDEKKLRSHVARRLGNIVHVYTYDRLVITKIGNTYLLFVNDKRKHFTTNKQEEEIYNFLESKHLEKVEKNRIFTEEDPYGEEEWDVNERKIPYKEELCQDLWDGWEIDKEIEKKLIKLAKDFFEDIELETEILDIHLTGSMVNYNYNVDSDIDVHIIIDAKDVNEDTKLVKKVIDGQRFVWNMKHNIVIKDHDVELYIMDKDEEHISNGLYSLMKHEWIKKPKYNPPDVDTEDIDVKYDARVYDIEKLERISDKDLDPEEAEDYYDKTKDLMSKIMKARKSGLREDGEFSIENLVFKKLRNEGKIKKLIDSMNRFYDKIYSQ
jgi:hypothetical protein